MKKKKKKHITVIKFKENDHIHTKQKRHTVSENYRKKIKSNRRKTNTKCSIFIGTKEKQRQTDRGKKYRTSK